MEQMCHTYPVTQVEAKRKEITEAEKAAAATQSRLSELRNNEKECALLPLPVASASMM